MFNYMPYNKYFCNVSTDAGAQNEGAIAEKEVNFKLKYNYPSSMM